MQRGGPATGNGPVVAQGETMDKVTVDWAELSRRRAQTSDEPVPFPFTTDPQGNFQPDDLLFSIIGAQTDPTTGAAYAVAAFNGATCPVAIHGDQEEVEAYFRARIQFRGWTVNQVLYDSGKPKAKLVAVQKSGSVRTNCYDGDYTIGEFVEIVPGHAGMYSAGRAANMIPGRIPARLKVVNKNSFAKQLRQAFVRMTRHSVQSRLPRGRGEPERNAVYSAKNKGHTGKQFVNAFYALRNYGKLAAVAWIRNMIAAKLLKPSTDAGVMLSELYGPKGVPKTTVNIWPAGGLWNDINNITASEASDIAGYLAGLIDITKDESPMGQRVAVDVRHQMSQLEMLADAQMCPDREWAFPGLIGSGRNLENKGIIRGRVNPRNPLGALVTAQFNAQELVFSAFSDIFIEWQRTIIGMVSAGPGKAGSTVNVELT